MIKNIKIFSITKKLKMKKIYPVICVSIENLKTLNYHAFLKKKKQFLLLFVVSVTVKMKKVFKEEESI